MAVHIVNEIPEPNDCADIERGVNEALRDRAQDEEWYVNIRPNSSDPGLYVIFLRGPKGFMRRMEFRALTLESTHICDTISSALDQKEG